tara:strand:- start:1706 stop:1996 length:291 start_codon:yes stop_codon:yes gene_type:complete
MKQYFDVMRRDYCKEKDVAGYFYRYFLVKTFSNEDDAKSYALKCHDYPSGKVNLPNDDYEKIGKVNEVSSKIEKQTGNIVCSVGYLVAKPHQQLTF